MCLININTVETKELRKGEQPIKAYKSVKVDRKGTWSVHFPFKWSRGMWMSSSRLSERLTSRERMNDKVNRGFHLYLDAEIPRETKDEGTVVAEFDVLPQDVIAVGVNEINGCEAIVASNAKLVHVERE